MVHLQRTPRSQVVQYLLFRLSLPRLTIHVLYDNTRRLSRRLLNNGIKTTNDYRVTTTERRLRNAMISLLMATRNILRDTTHLNGNQQIRGSGVMKISLSFRTKRRLGNILTRGIRVNRAITLNVTLHRNGDLNTSINNNRANDTTHDNIRYGTANINGTIRRNIAYDGTYRHPTIMLLVGRRTNLLPVLRVRVVMGSILTSLNLNTYQIDLAKRLGPTFILLGAFLYTRDLVITLMSTISNLTINTRSFYRGKRRSKLRLFRTRTRNLHSRSITRPIRNRPKRLINFTGGSTTNKGINKLRRNFTMIPYVFRPTTPRNYVGNIVNITKSRPRTSLTLRQGRTNTGMKAFNTSRVNRHTIFQLVFQKVRSIILVRPKIPTRRRTLNIFISNVREMDTFFRVILLVVSRLPSSHIHERGRWGSALCGDAGSYCCGWRVPGGHVGRKDVVRVRHG